MKIKRQILLSSFCMALLLSGCGSSDSSKEEKHDGHGHEEGHHHNEHEVTLTRAQMEKVDIQVGDFRNMQLANTIKATGRLELPPQNEASVGAMMRGIIEDIQVLPGEFVEKGAPLAYLKHPHIVELQQNYLENRSELAFLEKEYERQKSLYDSDVGSAKEFQKTTSQYNSLKARLKAQASKLRLLHINPENLTEESIRERIAVKAPIQGYIRDIHVKTGQHVNGNEEMFHIVDNHHIHIDLMVYEKDVPKIEEGQKLLFTLATRERDEVMEAEIFSLGRAMEHNQKSVRMHAELKHKHDHLLPGMYVEGQVVTDTLSGKVLPEDAVVMHDNHHYLFYQKHEENGEITFERVAVTPVVTQKGLTQVKGDALPGNENLRVVTHNAHYLLREMLEGAGGGHSH